MGTRERDARPAARIRRARTDHHAGRARARARCDPARDGRVRVWRGSDRPALLCTLADRSAVMMAMSGSPAAVRKIDAAVLESVILAPMLGLLESPDQFGTTDAVRYVRDLDTAVGFVDAGRLGRRLPAAGTDRAAGAGGRASRPGDAAEVDLLLPKAVFRVSVEPTRGLMRADWLAFCRDVASGRRGCAASSTRLATTASRWWGRGAVATIRR